MPYHMDRSRSLKLLRGLSIIYIMTGYLSGGLNSQVVIKENMILTPGNARRISTSSSAPVVKWTFTYRQCGGHDEIYLAGSPCNAYQERGVGGSVSGNRNGEVGTATLTFTAYDPGSYAINVDRQTAMCIDGPTCDHSACGEWASIEINGTQIPNNDGYAFVNTYSNVCDPANLQPQTSNDVSIETYKEGDTFTWTDPGGQPHSTIVSECGYNPKNIDISRRVGLTYIMPNVGPYVAMSDRVRDICLDNVDPDNPSWVLKNTNVRIPIFMSSCTNKTCEQGGERYREMGGNCIEWLQNITDRQTYEDAVEAMEWWVYGSYYWAWVYENTHGSVDKRCPPHLMTFSSMILAHEKNHKDEFADELNNNFNRAYANIFRKENRPKQAEYPCAQTFMGTGSSSDFMFLMDARGLAASSRGTTELETDNRASDDRKILFQQFQDCFKGVFH